MKKALYLASIAIAVTTLLTQSFVQAQNLNLRSNINPTCTGTPQTTKFADIYADGSIAVMGTYSCRGVFIFNVSNPDAPTQSAHYNPLSTTGQNIQFLEAIVIGNRGYFGSGSTSMTEGVHVVDLTNPSSPQLIAKVNALNGGAYSTVHEMMVFDQGGRRYLLQNSNTTSNNNLRIIDITDPTAAVLKWQWNVGMSTWVHAMHIRGDKVYLSEFFQSTQGRIEIYNISNLATQAPTRLGAVAVGLSSNHSTWTSEDGNYLYSARELSNSDALNAGDIRVYDVSNPASPLYINKYTSNDLGIVASTPHNPVVMGNKLYVAWYQAGTLVFDITNPASPVQIGRYDTWPAQFTEEDLAAQRAALSKFDPKDIICGENRQTNQLITGYNGNWAVYPFLGADRVLLGDLATGLYVVSATPTAANVSISGRVLTSDGAGLKNAVVQLILANGETLTARTGSFGYYRFDEIESGQTVVVSVASKRFTFAPQVVTVNGDLADIDFVAQ